MGTAMTSERGWEMLSRPDINHLVGWILSFWAGTVNTATTLAIFFERASHVSGRVNDIGMNIVLYPIDALLVFLIWITFVFGGFLAAKVLHRLGFTWSLLVVACGIGVGGLLVRGGFYVVDGSIYTLERMIMASFLPTLMGFQNGITTMVPIGRTTHWSGDSTDLGIALAQGNRLRAIHNTIKIFGFICGAAVCAYALGIRKDIPAEYVLFAIAIGYSITTILLYWINRALSKS
jgi:uncharacterized membrane protein YoaK (UPF0700 family)